MKYSINGLLSWAKILAEKTFGKKDKYEISFEKEDGKWYVVFPNWPLSKGNLQMVAGADFLCEVLSMKDGRATPNFTVEVIPSSKQLDLKDYCGAEQTSASLTGGADYKVTQWTSDLPDIGGWVVDENDNKIYDYSFWLCPVTLCVLGEYPKYLYFKKI